jgi:hypothetical protein
MIVFVYGDETAAAANVSVPFSWALEDPYELHKGLRAHPSNIPYGFGYKLSKLLHSGFHSAVLKDATVDNIVDNFLLQHSSSLEKIFVACWGKSQLGEKKKIEQFGDKLLELKVPACFINSNYKIESNHPLWLWDPKINSVDLWAQTNQLLANKGHLTSTGHTLLANKILNHLTTQLSVTIIEE